MSDWFSGLDRYGAQFLSALEAAKKTVVPDPSPKPAALDAERRNRPFAERIVREAGRDTLRGHRVEVSCPAGRVSVIDRSRTGGASRESHASTQFAEHAVGADVSCKVSGETVRLRIDRITAVLPRDVTIVYNFPKDRASGYGAGRTLREHEEAHVATGLALRTPAFVEDLFRGRLSYTSAVTGETVRFAGLSVPQEFASSARAFTKGRSMELALDAEGTRILDLVSDAALAYLREVIEYLDFAENHGPPLPKDARITPYRTVGGQLVLLRPPEPKKITIAF